jgi:hypothetical protein
MSKPRIILLSVAAAIALVAVGFGVTASAAKNRAESLNCASSVVSVCLAARVWAEDHGGVTPTNFLCMSNELSTPKILSCVLARRAHIKGWAEFTCQDSAYEILAPGMRGDDTNTAYLRCKIHGHLGYIDSTVFDGVRRRHKFE